MSVRPQYYITMNRKLDDKQYKQIIKMYEIGKTTTWDIAERFGITPRQVQRIAKDAGVIRSQAAGNRVAAPLKDYSGARVGKKRCFVPLQVRYDLLADHPYCSICGRTADDHVRLEIDHRNDDNSDNSLDNLWVLCDMCNKGKYWSNRKK